MAKSERGLLRLDHLQLAIPEGGEPACRAFWGGLPGLAEGPKPAGLAGRGGLWFRAGQIALHLGVGAGFSPARKAHPGFVMRDIAALAERPTVAGHAVTWDSAIAGRRRFFTADPFGNRLEFMGEN